MDVDKLPMLSRASLATTYSYTGINAAKLPMSLLVLGSKSQLMSDIERKVYAVGHHR